MSFGVPVRLFHHCVLTLTTDLPRIPGPGVGPGSVSRSSPLPSSRSIGEWRDTSPTASRAVRLLGNAEAETYPRVGSGQA